MGVSIGRGGCCGGGLLGTMGVNEYDEFVTVGLGAGGGCEMETEGTKCILGYIGGGETWVDWLASAAASIRLLCFLRHFFRPLLVWGIGGKVGKHGCGAKHTK